MGSALELLTALFGAGYQGPVEIEVLGPAIDAEAIEPALRRSVAAATALLSGFATPPRRRRAPTQREE